MRAGNFVNVASTDFSVIRLNPVSVAIGGKLSS
jgi:hypothetical protein